MREGGGGLGLGIAGLVGIALLVTTRVAAADTSAQTLLTYGNPQGACQGFPTSYQQSHTFTVSGNTLSIGGGGAVDTGPIDSAGSFQATVPRGGEMYDGTIHGSQVQGSYTNRPPNQPQGCTYAIAGTLSAPLDLPTQAATATAPATPAAATPAATPTPQTAAVGLQPASGGGFPWPLPLAGGALLVAAGAAVAVGRGKPAGGLVLPQPAPVAPAADTPAAVPPVAKVKDCSKEQAAVDAARAAWHKALKSLTAERLRLKRKLDALKSAPDSDWFRSVVRDAIERVEFAQEAADAAFKVLSAANDALAKCSGHIPITDDLVASESDTEWAWLIPAATAASGFVSAADLGDHLKQPGTTVIPVGSPWLFAPHFIGTDGKITLPPGSSVLLKPLEGLTPTFTVVGGKIVIEVAGGKVTVELSVKDGKIVATATSDLVLVDNADATAAAQSIADSINQQVQAAGLQVTNVTVSNGNISITTAVR